MEMNPPNCVVNRSCSSFVVPHRPTHPYAHFLSNFDQLYADILYVFNIYYFAGNPRCQHPQDLTESLKSSLSRVLVHYPVLAGRLRLNDQDRYEVFCNDAGAKVIEAFSDASLDYWEDLKDCPMKLEAELNPDDGVVEDYQAAPLLKVQITHFRCGGIALSLGWAHAVCDGCAATGFLKTWGEVHRGLAVSAPPNFGTIALKYSGLPPNAQFPPLDNYIPVPKLVNDSASAYNMNEIPETACSTASSTTIVLRFTNGSVEDIVKEVENGPWSYGSATPFEAVSALVWKAMTVARDDLLSLDDQLSSRYIIPVNCRPRLRPPLPPTYFANAKYMTSAVALAGDLKTRHISYAAHVIHEKLKEIECELIRGAIDWMELQMMKGNRVGFKEHINSGYDVQAVSFLGFACYEVDLGWGRPLHMSFPILPSNFGNGGVALLLPSAEEGMSMNVSISLPAHHMQKLHVDQTLATYLPPKYKQAV